ncbi:MAG: malectin domain-containing carbohydrate-binding protein [Terracidiphilus sp.]
MNLAGQEPSDLKAQRAELDVVLHSEHFTRAPMLAALLAYLCQKLFDGQAHQVKEYSVGVEVFHRGESFDQNSDSIVRVEANRLRKRLAAYYAAEGAAHQLQITIPLGQYVPEFKTAPAQPILTQPTSEAQVAAGPAAATTARLELRASRRDFTLTGRRALWIAGAFAVLFVLLGCTWLILRQMKQETAAPGSNSSAAQSAESQLGPPIGEEIRILAGSSRGFVDHAGKLWNADAWFEGGTTVRSTASISRTQDPDFYRTSRQGNFRYNIPLKQGVYELRLHFAEIVFDPELPGGGGEGSRLFTVRVDGRTLLTRFDIVADAGASHTADVKVFPGIAPAPDGQLHLEFAGDEGKQALLSAIEILPGYRGHMRPVRVLARPTPYYSNDSHWWSPDNYFLGGQLATYATPVSGSDDPELFETERWGNFSYAIPASPGKYTVLVHFAARHGNWDQSSSSGEGRAQVAHIFNLFCNGNTLLKNFDLVLEARQADVVTRKYTGLEPNAQGKLLLSFVPVNGYASVTGIEVLPQ